jgi:hypothetical protein
MDEEHDGASGGTKGDQGPGASKTPPVDIAVLAKKVYRLMREELRLERARGADTFGRKG